MVTEPALGAVRALPKASSRSSARVGTTGIAQGPPWRFADQPIVEQRHAICASQCPCEDQADRQPHARQNPLCKEELDGQQPVQAVRHIEERTRHIHSKPLSPLTRTSVHRSSAMSAPGSSRNTHRSLSGSKGSAVTNTRPLRKNKMKNRRNATAAGRSRGALIEPNSCQKPWSHVAQAAQAAACCFEGHVFGSQRVSLPSPELVERYLGYVQSSPLAEAINQHTDHVVIDNASIPEPKRKPPMFCNPEHHHRRTGLAPQLVRREARRSQSRPRHGATLHDSTEFASKPKTQALGQPKEDMGLIPKERRPLLRGSGRKFFSTSRAASKRDDRQPSPLSQSVVQTKRL